MPFSIPVMSLIFGLLAVSAAAGAPGGAASTEGSLAITQAEAGRVGVALELGERALAALGDGGYRAEQGLLALHLSCAAALAGDPDRARRLAEEEAAREAARERGLLAARAEALRAWAEASMRPA